MKDDTSTPTTEGSSPNEFEEGKPGTEARDQAEATIQELRKRGGIFVEAVRATRMPMALTDPNLPGNPIVFANEAFLKLSGYGMKEVLGQQPHFLNGAGTNQRDAARFQEALRSDQDDIIETVQYRKNGSRFVATVLISAFKNDAGKVLNHFMSWLDVTRRVEAEDEIAELRIAQERLRESEALLAATFESVPAGIASIGLDGNLIAANAEYRRFLPNGAIPSLDPERGQRWKGWDAQGRLLDPQEWPSARALRGESVKPGQEMLYTDDSGHQIWTNVASVPTFDEQGKVTAVVTTISDIDEGKRASDALKESERHAKLLLAELQHRVRNTLAVVRSIARRTSETSTSAEDMLAHFQGRLDAFSRVQAAMTRNPDGKVDLTSLIEDELLAHATREGEQVSIHGPPVQLRHKVAERLSLAIHELTTNAVKHGALVNGAGRIAVDWTVEPNGGGDRFTLRWKESGVDVNGRKLDRQGFGMELLRSSLPYDLGAETNVELKPTGLEFELRMRLNAGS